MTNERNKILIADDEEAMRTIGEMTLGENFPQFEIESFNDGTSLEERLKKEVDDVKAVITDNQMGRGILGGEIIAKYARKPEYKDIRFILCYGGNPLLGEAAKKAGAFECILKPEMTDYVDVVRKALEGRIE